jgi:hypothetical protein
MYKFQNYITKNLILAQFEVFDYLIEIFGLNKIWEKIQQANSKMLSQFQALLTQLLFAEEKTWEESKPYFEELVIKIAEGSDIDAALTLVIKKINNLLAEEKSVTFLI